jgi:D-alanine transaminase
MMMEQPEKSAIAYVNGAFTPLAEASISILDRGFLFGDGVYEVSAVLGGKLVDNRPHLDRLQRSLHEIQLRCPVTMAELTDIQEELIDRNALQEGIVYLQVTRGAAPRDFAHPDTGIPSLVMFVIAKNILNNPKVQTGFHVASVEDLRWKRRDIKSIALLAQVIARQEAAEKGCDEAWMVEDGHVTEGSSSTSFIITTENTLVTRPLSTAVLPGITRQAVLELVKEENLSLEERPFTLEEAYRAKEAFLTSASTFVMPVVKIDGDDIGDGLPGAFTMHLRHLYIERAKDQIA